MWCTMWASHCRGLKCGGKASLALATLPPGVQVAVLPSGDLRFKVALWETVVVYSAAPGGAAPPFAVSALPGNASQYNYWGMH